MDRITQTPIPDLLPDLKEPLTSLPSLTIQIPTEKYKSGYSHIKLSLKEKEHAKQMMLLRLKSIGIHRANLTDHEYQKALFELRERRYYAIETEAYWQRVRDLGTIIPKITAMELAEQVLMAFFVKNKRHFILNKDNEAQFTSLCLYFSGDPRFEKLVFTNKEGKKEPYNYKLNKGILLMGPKGTGKTTMMRMFRTNPHACFTVKSALVINQEYRDQKNSDTNDILDYYSKTIKVPNNANMFRHSELGLCMDDIGREDLSSKYSNTLNVIAYLISTRYENEIPFNLTHYVTNVSSDTLEQLYGARTRDIFSETINQIVFSAKTESYRSKI